MKFISISVWILCVLLGSARANAIIITDIVSIDKMITGDFRWTHDITDHGFDPTRDSIRSARLTLQLRDTEPDPDLEYGPFALVLIEFERHYTRIGQENFTTSCCATTLYTEGRESFVIIPLEGTFWFGDSILEVDVRSDVIGVPEPTTLALLCLGLAGLIMGRRRYR